MSSKAFSPMKLVSMYLFYSRIQGNNPFSSKYNFSCSHWIRLKNTGKNICSNTRKAQELILNWMGLKHTLNCKWRWPTLHKIDLRFQSTIFLHASKIFTVFLKSRAQLLLKNKLKKVLRASLHTFWLRCLH